MSDNDVVKISRARLIELCKELRMSAEDMAVIHGDPTVRTWLNDFEKEFSLPDTSF